VSEKHRARKTSDLWSEGRRTRRKKWMDGSSQSEGNFVVYVRSRKETQGTSRDGCERIRPGDVLP